ncbi:MAG: hypothetical protein PVF05_13010 [Gemmatimonadales bacterium]|jgi:hypothetical protein
MKIARTVLLATAAAGLLAAPAAAQVHYDQGRRMIMGIQLLQDSQDSLAYYYIPRFPRLARKDDGTFELLCLKYVGADGESSGGLFHALFEFGLPAEMTDSLAAALQGEVPNARLVGPVPLLQATADGEDGVGSFQVVSSVLREDADGGLARTVLTSGRAPLMPGSRAVVASLLQPEGATLLWNSLTGPTSDVSVSVHAYYEAVVEGYNARVEADIGTIYTHFQDMTNVQGMPEDGGDVQRAGGSPAGAAAAGAVGAAVAGPAGAAVGAGLASRGRRSMDPGMFSRDFISTVVDSLVRNGGINVTVLDRSEALDLDAAGMDAILSLILDKLVELMFDSTSGWAAEPPREQAVAYESIQGKTTEGWLAKAFGGRNRQYASDDLYVLKNRTDIRQNNFSIVLSRSTTIKVPVDASGNLGGLYESLDADPRYFRIVNLDDPAFQFRDVHFQVDGDFVDSFSDLVNFASVSVRKTYDDNPAVTRDLVFSLDDVEQGETIQEVSFPRLGEEDEDWNDYEYREEWSLRNGPTLTVPGDGSWARGTTAAVSLKPPFEKETVEIDVDRDAFERNGVQSANIRFATVLAGKAGKQRELRVRVDDPDPTYTVVIYHDPGEDVAYQVDWYTEYGNSSDDLALLDSSYLRLEGPAEGTP